MKSEYLAYGKKHKNEKYIKDIPYAAQDSKILLRGTCRKSSQVRARPPHRTST